MSIGYGIIGCGGIARFHFAALRKAQASIVHICDRDPSVAEPYRADLGCRFSQDADSLFADPDVTVVLVLTNTGSHRALCVGALEAGKDVFCEKTLADSEEAAYQIGAAARKTDRLFYLGYMKRHFPAVQKLRSLLPSLGRVFTATVRANQGWGNFYDTDSPGDFEIVFDKYGGAVLKCAGSHMIDMTLSLFGLPDAVLASVDYVGDSNFDRKATALFQYPDGMVVNFETATHPLSSIGYEKNSWEEWIQISGTGGRLELHTVQWDHPLNNPVRLVHYDEASQTTTVHHFAPADPFTYQLQALESGLRSRAQTGPDVVDGYNVDLMIDSIVRADREQRRIAIGPRISR